MRLPQVSSRTIVERLDLRPLVADCSALSARQSAQAAQAGITLAPPGALRRMESESLGVRLCLGVPATEADLERALIEIRRILEMAEAISFV